jgi:uncharacterized protein YbgA (DUF1722 family)
MNESVLINITGYIKDYANGCPQYDFKQMLQDYIQGVQTFNVIFTLIIWFFSLYLLIKLRYTLKLEYQLILALIMFLSLFLTLKGILS